MAIQEMRSLWDDHFIERQMKMYHNRTDSFTSSCSPPMDWYTSILDKKEISKKETFLFDPEELVLHETDKKKLP